MSADTQNKIAYMQEGGTKLGVILGQLLHAAQPGVSLIEVEKLAQRLIKEAEGEASFQTVKDYRWATCLCVNDVVVHGIPTDYQLKEGDMLTIDVGILYQGFHTDTAWTKIVRSQKQDKQNEKERFLKIGEEALWSAIDVARVGNRVGHISQVIQRIVQGAGYGIVRTLVGHGVGRELHEEPQIPGILKTSIESTPELVPDMTIAIEVIYAMGSGAVVYANDDGWSIASRDGSLTAVFEHSVVVTRDRPMVLTRTRDMR
ncbi:MAG: Methionine aminopeptidase [Microgenomates group bacterium GW2011_GWA2_47_8]|nr:MAG: Methionine aminopeptidase [Microgenomates group bacterium GW2011_GWA2_47_8]